MGQVKPRQNLPSISRSHAMPQRPLTKAKPWVFVSVNDLSLDINSPAVSHLEHDPNMADIVDINNDLAFSNPPPSKSATTKRKRDEPTIKETSPNKRTVTKTSHPNGPDSPKAVPKKLGRPKKVRHMISTYPGVAKPKGDDVYTMNVADVDLPPSNQMANTKAQKVGKVKQPKGRQPANEKASSPLAGSLRGKKGSRRTAPANENLEDAIPVRADKTRKISKRKVVKSKDWVSTREESRSSVKLEEDASVPPETRQCPESGDSEVEPISVEGPSQESNARSTASADGTQHVDGGRDETNNNNEEESQRSEEENSESEVDPEAEETEKVEEAMGSFGQKREWQKVLQSAKSVRDMQFNIRCTSETIIRLLSYIKEAISLYKQLKKIEDDSASTPEALLDQLRHETDTIEGHIDDIEEHKEPKKRSKIIRDIFGYAIPAMVFLLESALILRVSQRRGLHKYSTLEEIVRIQEMMLKLCTKANAWKAKPNTDLPIIKPTKSVMYPYIRDMKFKVFDKQLKILYRDEKTRRNAQLTKQKEEQAKREAPSRSQSVPYDPDVHRRHMEEERQRRRERAFGESLAPTQVAIVQPVKRIATTTPHDWTCREIQELVVQLERTKHLEGKSNLCVFILI